jgi:hypothetical protein
MVREETEETREEEMRRGRAGEEGKWNYLTPSVFLSASEGRQSSTSSEHQQLIEKILNRLIDMKALNALSAKVEKSDSSVVEESERRLRGEKGSGKERQRERREISA